ncbi:hypothetical protein LR48_Vigan09g092000 [Vigna angularis]|uniref:Uncharacterized protein n=1 Tax=Phaseolus angularis TaxID=3914 RepID=A0A0L9VB16_PHAAN|nr:hypothetical protein LR48_Vigan09g092000 [Vigna angularis]
MRPSLHTVQQRSATTAFMVQLGGVMTAAPFSYLTSKQRRSTSSNLEEHRPTSSFQHFMLSIMKVKAHGSEEQHHTTSLEQLRPAVITANPAPFSSLHTYTNTSRMKRHSRLQHTATKKKLVHGGSGDENGYSSKQRPSMAGFIWKKWCFNMG